MIKVPLAALLGLTLIHEAGNKGPVEGAMIRNEFL